MCSNKENHPKFKPRGAFDFNARICDCSTSLSLSELVQIICKSLYLHSKNNVSGNCCMVSNR